MSDKFVAAAALVALTLVIQCAWVARLIVWGRARFGHKHPNYTTVGAADVLLPQWRAFGPLESLTGILMCGLSVSFLFAITTRLVQHTEM